MIGAGLFSRGTNGFPGFRLDRTGESVHLFAATADGRLTGYHHGVSFPAAPLGSSYGRVSVAGVAPEEQWVVSPITTLGTTNASPRPGTVVFSEIMYHAVELAEGVDRSEFKFLGVFNTLAQRVLAFDPLIPTNTWRISGAIGYRFPAQFVFP